MPNPTISCPWLRGFFSNHLDNHRGFRDSAEIIWYDFKDQALELIHDISIWGNIDNFKRTVDPDNPFSGQSPRTTDRLLDEVMDGASGIKGPMLNAKKLLVMKISWLLELSFIMTRQALMFIKGQDWNQCHLHSLFLIENSGTGQRHGMFLDMSLI